MDPVSVARLVPARRSGAGGGRNRRRRLSGARRRVRGRQLPREGGARRADARDRSPSRAERADRAARGPPVRARARRADLRRRVERRAPERLSTARPRLSGPRGGGRARSAEAHHHQQPAPQVPAGRDRAVQSVERRRRRAPGSRAGAVARPRRRDHRAPAPAGAGGDRSGRCVRARDGAGTRSARSRLSRSTHRSRRDALGPPQPGGAQPPVGAGGDYRGRRPRRARRGGACRGNRRPVADRLDAQRVLGARDGGLRSESGVGAGARRHRAGDHLRRDGRHQHGPRRVDDARRLHDLRRAALDAGPHRHVAARGGTGRLPRRGRPSACS